MSRDLTPHDLRAERCVLGAVAIDNDALEVVASALAPEAFFRTAHQQIYAAMLELRKRRSVIDLVTLASLLEQRGELEAVGGAAYVASLIDGVPTGMHIAHHAGIVAEKAVRRELIQAARQIQRMAFDEDATAEALVDEAEARLVQLAAHTQTAGLVTGKRLSDEAVAWLEEVATRAQSGRLSGVPTGLPLLDEMTDGLQPGELIIIGARPSQGKTALALQLALEADGPCAFFSLEMRRAQLSTRALAWLARVDGWALRRGRLTSAEYERVSRALDRLAESGVAIDDASELSIWQLRSKARRWQAQHGLRMVVVDYLQLMAPPKMDKRRQVNREQEVAALSRALKGLAKELRVPVVALSQLNRAVESRGSEKPPTLADLRESGALEQDADVVIFLHRTNGASVKDEGEAQLILAKHRNGPTGTVLTWWIPAETRFRPISGDRDARQGVA